MHEVDVPPLNRPLLEDETRGVAKGLHVAADTLLRLGGVVLVDSKGDLPRGPESRHGGLGDTLLLDVVYGQHQVVSVRARGDMLVLFPEEADLRIETRGRVFGVFIL